MYILFSKVETNIFAQNTYKDEMYIYQLHTFKYIIPTSLFYYINGHCFKFATSLKKIAPSMPTCDINVFLQGSIPESLVEKKIKIDKVTQHLLKPCTFYTLEE